MKNGCHNRPPVQETLRVPDGWSASGHRLTKPMPFVMSRDCKHDKRDTDPGCAGCKWIGNAVAA